MNPAVATFDRYADAYDCWFDEAPQAFEEQVAALRRVLPRAGTGLEIGVGSGRYAAGLGIRHGLDPSTALLELARQRGIVTVLGVGESLPYRAGTFDYALMMAVICFMDDLSRSCREAFRVILPGGILAIGFFEREGEIALRERERKPPGRFFRHAKFRSIDEVKSALATAGFSSVILRADLHGLCLVTAQRT